MRAMEFAKRAATAVLSVQLILATQYATAARAEMVGTEAAIARYAAQADRQFLLDELQRKEIRDEIVKLGVDPAEAEARLAALSDAEVAAMLADIDDDVAGASSIVGALLTVFLVLLVTDILCLTRVFKFTRCSVR